MNKNKRQRQQEIRAQKQAAAKRKQSLLRYGMVAGVLVLLVAVVMAFTQNWGLTIPDTREVTAQDQVKGYQTAPMTLVEYSDFQCPACRAQHNTIRTVWKDIRRQVKLVYRHFPLTTIHPHATRAAEYAEAAGQQGKFWEMHDQLFDQQRQWSQAENPDSLFNGYAEALGLDMEKLKQDLESDAVLDKIRADSASGRRAGVNSTPTLFLDGERLMDVRSPQGLIKAIEIAREFQ